VSCLAGGRCGARAVRAVTAALDPAQKLELKQGTEQIRKGKRELCAEPVRVARPAAERAQNGAGNLI
jgi:hypothetical protein